MLTSVTVDGYPISIQFVWGNSLPYYGNSSTTTEVTIEDRFTQLTVLQTPPGYYFFNMSALFSFTDYLSGAPIQGATLTITCLEVPSFIHWEFDNTDGTYSTIMNTTSFFITASRTNILCIGSNNTCYRYNFLIRRKIISSFRIN